MSPVKLKVARLWVWLETWLKRKPCQRTCHDQIILPWQQQPQIVLFRLSHHLPPSRLAPHSMPTPQLLNKSQTLYPCHASCSVRDLSRQAAAFTSTVSGLVCAKRSIISLFCSFLCLLKYPQDHPQILSLPLLLGLRWQQHINLLFKLQDFLPLLARQMSRNSQAGQWRYQASKASLSNVSCFNPPSRGFLSLYLLPKLF
jgi:hypothetical protein